MSKGKDLKPHIGIFGRRNNGKSSFINVIVDQELSIVSEIAGTTTDPVKKSVEIFGIGPSIIIDTAGFDDSGELGKKRIEKTIEVVKTVDCAILLISNNEFDEREIEFINILEKYDLPFLIVHNKSDLDAITIDTIRKIKLTTNAEVFDYSNFNKSNLSLIIGTLKKIIPETIYRQSSLFKGIIKAKDIVLLVTPIDSEAPEGRMILPQVMALRDVLDNDCICVVVKETELEDFIKTGLKPSLVVTDSQAFAYVSQLIPVEIPLTSFSILFAHFRGNFDEFLEGTPFISKLIDNDKILILESCTHQVHCDDIGRHKLPKWIKEFTKKEIQFDIISGLSPIINDINSYSMIIQCGGCMITRKQLINRLKPAIDEGIPVTNYGMAIAFTQGIFKRVTAPFILK